MNFAGSRRAWFAAALAIELARAANANADAPAPNASPPVEPAAPSPAADANAAPEPAVPVASKSTAKKNTKSGELPAVPNPSQLVLGGVPKDEYMAGPPLVWHWQRFSTFDYVLSGAAAAVTLTTAIVNPRASHSVSGGILFDDAVRNAVRPSSLHKRYQFRDASDVGLSLAVTWPFFADSLVTAWWYRGSRDVAEQMALIDFEALTLAGAIQGATNVLVSRERPYGRNCGTDALPDNANDCVSSSHFRSFFSGHSAFSFTSAALICAHHFENDLLGPPYDALSCAGGYVVAATTASFRVVGDMHYASDVLLGAIVGTTIGYGVPLLHYRQSRRLTSTNGLKLSVVPTAGGIGLMGMF